MSLARYSLLVLITVENSLILMVILIEKIIESIAGMRENSPGERVEASFKHGTTLPDVWFV